MYGQSSHTSHKVSEEEAMLICSGQYSKLAPFCRYANLLGASAAELRQAFNLYPPLRENYTKEYERLPLRAVLEEVTELLHMRDEFHFRCRNISNAERKAISFKWFQVKTIRISLFPKLWLTIPL